MKVLPLKVLDENGDGWDEDVALAIRHAADAGARVINLSMGGSGSTTLSEAVAYARAKGCVLVAAAGNSGLDQILYPAGTPGVIGVGSVDSQSRQALFSNSGPHVDVCAPGEEVYSTSWPRATASGGNLYGYMSGTSMATPIVSAEAALLFSAMPSASNTQVESAIMNSARDLGPEGKDEDYGRGIVDAAKALSLLVGYDYTPPTTVAVGVPSGWTSQTVTVTLKSTDDLSGVGTTMVRVGDVEARAYAGPIEVTSEGVTELTFWAVDRADNHEDAQTVAVRIDRTPPSTASDALSRYVGEAVIHLAPRDPLSGVASTRFVFDGVEGYGTVVRTRTRGFHTLLYNSVDAAGNAEGQRTVAFSLVTDFNDVLPVTTAALGTTGGWSSKPATITLISSVGGSTLSTGIRYSVNEGPETAYSAPFGISREGTNTVDFWTVADGVREATKRVFVRIDSSEPTLTIDAASTYDDWAVVVASASDVVSGVGADGIEWSLDGLTWLPGSAAYIDAPGAHRVWFRATDLAGNRVQNDVSILVTRPSWTSLGWPTASPAWGASAPLEGRVSPAPTAGSSVAIQQRVSGGSGWRRVALVRTRADGRFATSVSPRVRSEYRAVFAGDALLRTSASTRVVVTPRVSLTAPAGVPRSARSGSALTLSGRVVPAHSSAVYLVIDKAVGDVWVKSAQHPLVMRSDGRGGSTWKAARRLARGTWRLRVYHASDGQHAATYSAAQYVRVR